MYPNYHEEAETWGLRNPYASPAPAPGRRVPDPLRLAGLVGAGLSVVFPLVGRHALPAEPAVTVDTATAGEETSASGRGAAGGAQA